MASLISLDEFAAFGLPAAATAKLDDPIKQAHLDAASDEAMAIGLRARYGTGITAVDMACKMRIAHIASYWMLAHRGFNPDGKDLVPKSVYDAAVAWFTDVGGGLISPTVTTTTNGSDLPDVSGGLPDRGWRDGMHGRSAPVSTDESEV